MFRVPESQREATYHQFMQEQKEVIPKVLEKYQPDKTGLTGLTEHINNKEIRPYSSHRETKGNA